MATLTLEEFLPKARELNPDYSDDELIQAYQERYVDAPTHTVSPAPLMTLEEFLPKARQLNPEYSDDELTEAWQEKYGARGAREKDQGDFWRGGATAFKQIPQLLGGVEAGAGAVGEKVFGTGGLFTALKEHGLKNYREAEQEIAAESKPSDSVTESYKMARAGNPGALVDWLQHTLGYAGGQAVQMLATAGLGYVGGKLALKSVAETAAGRLIAKESARIAATEQGAKLTAEAVTKQAVSNVAGKIGQLGALGSTAVGMEGGEIFGGLVDKATQEGRSLTGEELAKATGATLAAGGLEFVGDKIGLDLVLGRSIAKGLVTSRLGHAGAAGVIGTTTEGMTEFSQTLLEEFGKGNDPFSPESITQAIDAAAVGGVAGGAMGTIGGILHRPDDRTIPEVTERQPEEMGLTPEVIPPRETQQITGPPQPGEVRAGTIYGEGPVLDVEPLPDISPVTSASTLDEAIAGAVGVVQGATETAKARAAEFARMTARARNEAARLVATAPEKRAGTDIPILSGPGQAEPDLFTQSSPIVPGQAFTPRVEPEADPRQRLADERARMLAERAEQQASVDRAMERARTAQPATNWADLALRRHTEGTPAQEPARAPDKPLPTAQQRAIDEVYPSVDDLHRLAESKGLQWDNNQTFMELTKMATGKRHLDQLTPLERELFAQALKKIKAPQPAKVEEKPPSVPLTPIKERPYAPVTTIPEAQVPRSELPPEQNAEVLLRAEKAKADMEIAGTERGGRFFVDQERTGGTKEIVGLKSPTPDWYKELTSGPSPAIRGDRKQSAREKIEEAIAKIIKNRGADRGKAVEQVKAALLQDQEFHQTEWGRDLQSILDGEWPEWMEKPAGTSTTPSEAPVVLRGTPQVIDEVPAQQEAVEKAAHAAATSPQNDLPEPTEGQKEAGNYQKGHVRIAGLDVSIENPAGSERSGRNAQGEPWSQTLQDHYGYVRGTKGKDKEHIDIFVKPGTPNSYNGPMFVVDQKNQDGTFDEHKIIAGASSADEARQLYQRNYSSDWDGLMSIKAFTMPEFKVWLKAGNKQKPAGNPKAFEKAAALKTEADKLKAPKDALALIDRLYRDILDNTKVVHTMQREQKDRWATVKRIDQAMKDSLKAGKDYEEAAQGISAQDLTALSSILEGKAPVKATPSKADTLKQEAEKMKAEEAKERKSPISVPSEPEPFSPTAPTVTQPKAKAEDRQTSFELPAPTIGTRPIIGREVTPEEAPLFSKAAQTPETEQTQIDETPRQAKEPWERTQKDILGAIDRVDKAAANWDEEGFQQSKPQYKEDPNIIHRSDDINFGYLFGEPNTKKAKAHYEYSIGEGIEKDEGRHFLLAKLVTEDGRSQKQGAVGEYAGTGNGIMASHRNKGAGKAFFKELMNRGIFEPEGLGYSPGGLAVVKSAHRSIVQDALAEGKPVPPEVLADYPDLQPKAQETQAQSPTDILASALRSAADQIEGKKSEPAKTKPATTKKTKETDQGTALYEEQPEYANLPSMATDRGPGSSRDAQTPPEPGRVTSSYTHDKNGRPFTFYRTGEISLPDDQYPEQGRAIYFTRNEQTALDYRLRDSTGKGLPFYKVEIWPRKIFNPASSKTDRAVYKEIASHLRRDGYDVQGLKGYAGVHEQDVHLFDDDLRARGYDSIVVDENFGDDSRETSIAVLDPSIVRVLESSPNPSSPQQGGPLARELMAKYGLTDTQELGDTESYALREGEQQQLNFDLAQEAIGSLSHETAPVSSTTGAFSGDRVSARTIGLGISPEFIEQGTIDLTGQTVRSADDLAQLAQVYRNPLFETLRIFYVRNGKIVGHEGITSRLPGLVKFAVSPDDAAQRVKEWSDRKTALKATGYYILHNHPSGNSNPSSSDVALTERIAGLLPGFKGHVVIDSNEFSTLDYGKQGKLESSTRKRDFGQDRLLTPSVPHPLLGTELRDHLAVARVGKALQAPQGFVTVLYRAGTGGKIRAIQEISATFLAHPEQAARYIQEQAQAFGAAQAITHYAMQNNDPLAERLARSMDKLIEQGVLVDYVTTGVDRDAAMSRRDFGVMPGQNAPFMGREFGEIGVESVAEEQPGYDTGTIDPPSARERLQSTKSSLRPYLLGALGLEQIAQVYGREHAEVRQYNQATQAMEADVVEMSRASDQIVKAWTKLKIPVADAMARVMEDARFLNFDPDPQKNQEADSQKKTALRARFEALPDDAKTTYRLARDFYTDMAEDRFQALKERIERAGGTPENTKKLVDRLQIAYEQVRSKVYFPFTRFGENIVVAKQMKDGKEVDREVHAFESTAEAQKFATMMKMKGWQVKQTVAREYSVDKQGPASKIVRQMYDIIKELDEQPGLPGVANLTDQLLDSLNQSFLQALPDMSYAKHFIHAKDVKGASKDALRAFAHSAMHGAHHISRIRHADRITDALTRLDDRINQTTEGDLTEARQVYNELVQRHNQILNPNTHPVSAWLGQLGFTMSLGGVVATGVTNATQVPLITYPWLGARFGFGKASAALARAYKDFLDPRTLNKDSLFDATKSKLISESERKMLLELARRGRIDLTQTMDLAGLSGQDNLSRRAKMVGTLQEKVTRMLGFTFHAPEVMNRQVTALAAFRLEKDKGGSYEAALQRADQAIVDTHFIYTADNRPRYMSGNVLRVLTMFKQYSQNIVYLYGRAASIWLDKNNTTAEERTIAKQQLLSMLALQFGAAGALGLPFFKSATDLLMAVLSAADDDDERRDWEVSFRKWLDGSAASLYEAMTGDREAAEAFGKTAGATIAHGASRLTPWDMSGRLGQNDLFFREPQREREGRMAAMDWITSLSGPVAGYIVNGFLGVGDMAKGIREADAGFFLRGVEEMTPAVLRNGLKSIRYATEDVRTRDQYKQLELNTRETLGQFFGFTPSRVADMYESVTAVKNREHRIINQRKTLMDRFARTVTDQNDSARQKVLADIQAFNSRNPMFAITSDGLNRSVKARAQHAAGMERGMYLPPKRRALLDEGDFGDF